MYQAHFGFKKPVFERGIAQDAAVFMAPQHEAIVANSKVALTTFDSAVVLTGVAGVGKTTLMSAALRTTSTRLALGWLTGAPANGAELLELLLVELGFNAHRVGRVERMQMWRQFLNEMSATSSRVYVIAERAEDLSPEVLRALDSLTAADPNGSLGANLVLLGQPMLNEYLKAPVLGSLRQRIRLRQQLDPLDAPMLRSYLDHQVKLAGGELDKVFAANAIAALHRYSAGIPRVANNLCETALELAANDQQPTVTAELLIRVAVDLFGMEPADRDTTPMGSVAQPASAAAPPAAQTTAPTAPVSPPPTHAMPSTAQAMPPTEPATAVVTPPSAVAPAQALAPSAVSPNAAAAAAAAPVTPQPVEQSAPSPASTDLAPLTRVTPAVSASASAESGRVLGSPRTPLAAPARPQPEQVAAPESSGERRFAPLLAATSASAAQSSSATTTPVTAAATASSSAPTPSAVAPAVAPADSPSSSSRAPKPLLELDVDSFADTLTCDAADVLMTDFPVLTDAIEPPAPPRPRTRAETAYVKQPSRATPSASTAKPAAPPPRVVAAAAPPAKDSQRAFAPLGQDVKPPAPPTPRETAELQDGDALRQTQTVRALAAAKSIDDISNSMAETLFGEADLDMLSAALASAGWSDDDTPTLTPAEPAAPAPSAAAPKAVSASAAKSPSAPATKSQSALPARPQRAAAAGASPPQPVAEEDPFDFLGLGPDAPLELIEDLPPARDVKKAVR